MIVPERHVAIPDPIRDQAGVNTRERVEGDDRVDHRDDPEIKHVIVPAEGHRQVDADELVWAKAAHR